MGKMVTVGIADLNVVKGDDSLVTYALGSCVGVCLYSSRLQVAGMVHVMLPDSTQLSGGASQPHKFADTGIDALLKKMQSFGILSTAGLTAKIAGGAQMFAAMSNSAIANIGDRNVTAVKQKLASLHIPIVAENTGSNYGRTLFFYAIDGSAKIKSAQYGEKPL